MHRRPLYHFNFIAAALLMLWVPLAMTKDSFSVAIVLLMAPTVIDQNWGPFLRHLEKLTGHQFALRAYDQFDQFERAFKAGVPDFVYLNPYHAVMAKHAQGYIPLVRSNNEPLTAILVAQADGAAHQLRDLEGKAVAFASPNAFAPLYLRAWLNEKEKSLSGWSKVSNPQAEYERDYTPPEQLHFDHYMTPSTL